MRSPIRKRSVRIFGAAVMAAGAIGLTAACDEPEQDDDGGTQQEDNGGDDGGGGEDGED